MTLLCEGRGISSSGSSTAVSADGQSADLLALLQEIDDRSLFSPALQAASTGLSAAVHLSARRHCLLRPLPIKPGQRVLEMGCAGGALTRYLGECGAEVHALESDALLASIAACRCQDLPNVFVRGGAEAVIPVQITFDWVIYVDAPERKRILHLDDLCGQLATVLAPGGHVVLALFNKFGLQRFHAANSRNRRQGLSQQSLAELLRTTGLTEHKFYFPFPDHYFPDLVVEGHAMHKHDLRPADLVLHDVVQRWPKTASQTFSEALLFADLADAGSSLTAWCNSFLVVAGKQALPGEEVGLVWRFEVDRPPGFATQTAIIEVGANLEVRRSLLPPDASVTELALPGSGKLRAKAQQRPYIDGESFLSAIAAELGDAIDAMAVAKLLMPWFECLLAQTDTQSHSGLTESERAVRTLYLPGALFDALPSRSLSTTTGFQVLPSAWEYEGMLPFLWVVARGVHEVLQMVSRRASNQALNVPTLVQALCVQHDLKFDVAEIEGWVDWMTVLTTRLAGYTPTRESLISPPAGNEDIQAELHRLMTANVALTVAVDQRDQALSEMRKAFEERAERAATLNQWLAERDSLVRGLREELTARHDDVQSLEQKLENVAQALQTQERALQAVHSSKVWRWLVQPLHRCKYSLLRVQALRLALQRLGEQHGGVIGAANTLFQAARQGGRAGVLATLRDAVVAPPLKPSDDEPAMSAVTVSEETGAQVAPAIDIDYLNWVQRYDTLDEAAKCQIVQRNTALPAHPTVGLLALLDATTLSSDLGVSAQSLCDQLYPNWQLFLVPMGPLPAAMQSDLAQLAKRDTRICYLDGAGSGMPPVRLNAVLEDLHCDYVGLMPIGGQLAASALYWLVAAALQHADAGLVYADEDQLDNAGQRQRPVFKPDWNPELLLAYNYIGHAWLARTAVLQTGGGLDLNLGAAMAYDALLRCTEQLTADRIVHVPRILYHFPQLAASTELTDPAVHAQALADVLVRTRKAGRVCATDGLTPHIAYELPEPAPLVSIIIPTRDGLHLLGACIKSVLGRTDYPAYEILIVDNGSTDPALQVYLDDLQAQQSRVRVLRDDGPFNYSRLNNRAVALAEGTVLCLLNNDVEVITPGWLRELVSLALQDGVGAVGARLWYPDETIQHAGVVLGIGYVAGHVHKDLPRGTPGYMYRALVRQCFSAVTGACLVLRKVVFDQVGGLDEEHLPVAFNDVDLCLRMREAGYRNVWTPHAELYHREAASRGRDNVPARRKSFGAEVAYMKTRWGQDLLSDPYYNPNLTLRRTDFAYAWPPRLELLGYASASALT